MFNYVAMTGYRQAAHGPEPRLAAALPARIADGTGPGLEHPAHVHRDRIPGDIAL